MKIPTYWKIITNCSNRKHGKGPCVEPNQNLDNIDELLLDWLNKIRKNTYVQEAAQTYVGRSTKDAIAVKESVKGEMYFISAGLGLIHSFEKIPSYNLTVSKGENTLHRWLKEKNLSSKDWWAYLNKHLGFSNPVSTLISANPDSGFLISLPSTYIEMISSDISHLSEQALKNIRIFTSKSGQMLLPTELQNQCLPYTSNLEGISGFNGTQNDFPQRAMRHFITDLSGQTLNIKDSINAVNLVLSSTSKPLRPERTKLDDESIEKLIEINFERLNGKSQKLLRFLRDESKVSCEQSRFKNLMHKVKKKGLEKSFI